MPINNNGTNLIKKFEGLKLNAYICPAGVPTIGYGHTKDVELGMEITEEEADELLREDLEWACKAVDELVTAPITANQFAALVSFVFNVGKTNFKMSTLLKRLNEGHVQIAADELLRWNKITVKGKKVVSNGLARRRKAERELFLKDYEFFI